MLEEAVDSAPGVNDTLSEGRAQAQMLEFLNSDLSPFFSFPFPPSLSLSHTHSSLHLPIMMRGGCSSASYHIVTIKLTWHINFPPFVFLGFTPVTFCIQGFHTTDWNKCRLKIFENRLCVLYIEAFSYFLISTLKFFIYYWHHNRYYKQCNDVFKRMQEHTIICNIMPFCRKDAIECGVVREPRNQSSEDIKDWLHLELFDQYYIVYIGTIISYYLDTMATNEIGIQFLWAYVEALSGRYSIYRFKAYSESKAIFPRRH